jgi:hypothetical protein
MKTLPAHITSFFFNDPIVDPNVTALRIYLDSKADTAEAMRRGTKWRLVFKRTLLDSIIKEVNFFDDSTTRGKFKVKGVTHSIHFLILEDGCMCLW